MSDTAKKLCLERDANRCATCGTNSQLDVYQLTERPEQAFWQLSNLVTLCKNCRAEAEHIQNNHNPNRIGVLLAGGRGSRLSPLTNYLNKHTIPIGILPMIYYPLKTLRALGVQRAVIVVDRFGARDIIPMLGSGKAFGMDLSYKVQEGAMGISGALGLIEDLVKPTDEIVCVLGDNIFDNETLDKDIVLGENKACVYTKKVENPSDYGVAEIVGGKVTRIVEKPKEFISDLAVVGLYIYTPDVFGVIKGIKPSKRGELEISTVNDWFAANNQLIYKEVSGFWGDAGSDIGRYARCSMMGAKMANVTSEEIDDFKYTVFGDK